LGVRDWEFRVRVGVSGSCRGITGLAAGPTMSMGGGIEGAASWGPAASVSGGRGLGVAAVVGGLA
jgi:hypothetical protein